MLELTLDETGGMLDDDDELLFVRFLLPRPLLPLAGSFSFSAWDLLKNRPQHRFGGGQKSAHPIINYHNTHIHSEYERE